MIFRQATQEDIPAMQVVRNAVKENVLSDPSVISNAAYILYLEERGMGWTRWFCHFRSSGKKCVGTFCFARL